MEEVDKQIQEALIRIERYVDYRIAVYRFWMYINELGLVFITH